MMMTASSAASATARRILAMTRLRARRLVLWMEHVWQSGRGSPDQGPTIGPGEVARLLAAETALAEEAAFLAAGEASVLTAEADAATAAAIAGSCHTPENTESATAGSACHGVINRWVDAAPSSGAASCQVSNAVVANGEGPRPARRAASHGVGWVRRLSSCR